jgi:expansin
MKPITTFAALLPTLATVCTAYQGQATWYGGNLHGGACGFSTYNLLPGIYGTAMTDQDWWGSKICGACIQVTRPGGNSITAMVNTDMDCKLSASTESILRVINECPGRGNAHLDLFPDAFSALANPNVGVIGVT